MDERLHSACSRGGLHSYQRHSILLHLPLMFPPAKAGGMTYAGLTH
jgi:hypothetical protein